MARKFSVCFILSALIFGSVLPAFAIGSTTNPNPEPTSFSQKHQHKLFGIGGRIEDDLKELGNNILKYNKPAFEVKLTKEERTVPEDDYDPNTKMILSPVMYSRVCVKGRTIVLGSAGKDKNFTADFILTGEPGFPSKSKEATDNPNLTNYDGIYVGARVGIIEKFVGISAQTITKIQQQEDGIIIFEAASYVIIRLAYKDGKITELYHHNGYAMNSPKVWDFADKKAKELGLTSAHH